MNDATAGEVRRADRALAGATGALLAERLLTTAADHAAGLGGVGALASCRLLGDNHLVHQGDRRLAVEEFGREVDGTVGLAVGGMDVECQVRHA